MILCGISILVKQNHDYSLLNFDNSVNTIFSELEARLPCARITLGDSELFFPLK
jgi:hypothetical protein